MMVFISFKNFRNEELWNGLTHFIGVILSILGIPFLFYYNNNLTTLSTLSIILFAFGLLSVYVNSTIYHLLIYSKLKKSFQVLDHISIYFLILGSYAPICLITLFESSGKTVFFLVLGLSMLGILKKLFFTGKFKILSLALYLVMGWAIVFDLNFLFSLLSFNARLLLVLGGASYTFGVVFYAYDKIKYFHSVWHLFVLTGSILHYLMILKYII